MAKNSKNSNKYGNAENCCDTRDCNAEGSMKNAKNCTDNMNSNANCLDKTKNQSKNKVSAKDNTKSASDKNY